MSHSQSPFVFVSHSSNDNSEAQALVGALRTLGISTWIDIEQLQPGKPYPTQIERAILNCSAVIVVFSRSANESPFVQSEVELAFGKVPIYPARIEDVLPSGGIRLFLSSTQRIDVFGPDRANNIARLANAIREEIGSSRDPLDEMHRADKTEQDPEPQPPKPPRKSLEELFVGSRYPYFAQKWRQSERRNVKYSSNVPAIIFPQLWFSYRKMQKHAYICASVIIAIWVSAVIVDPTGKEGGISLMIALSQYIFSISYGLFANNIYKNHVDRHIISINERFDGKEDIESEIIFSGGTSLPYLFLMILYMLIGMAFMGSFVKPN